MQSQYNVLFTGELKTGFDRDAVVKAFSQRFQCTEAKAAEIIGAGKAIIMKSAVAREAAEKYQETLDALGMMITLEPVPTTNQPAETVPASSDPYQTPKANLNQRLNDGEMSGPVSVPVGHGWSWIGSAWSNHFKKNPFAWIGSLLLMIILSAVIQLIPLLGMIVTSLLSPVLGAGFMLGAKAQNAGENFTVGHLFSGFKQSTGQLILVGLFYVIGIFVILVVVALTMTGSLSMLVVMESGDPAAMEAMMQDPSAILLPILVMLLLAIPLIMAYWFAPALVALDGVSALNAMKLSFIGCVKNILPFLLYGIVLFVLIFIAAIPLGLGLLIVVPLMVASMYTSYRDIYHSGV